MRRRMMIVLKGMAAGLAAALCAAAAIPCAFAAPGSAELVVAGSATSNPFSALVGKKRKRRADRVGRGTIERYVLASDDRAFLLEERSRQARVKFLCGPNDRRLDCTIDPAGPAAEIYPLTVTRGPRGDVFYKTAEGDTMLRIASYGGATVFWPGERQGFAASKSFGDDEALRLVFADIDDAKRRAQAATAVISALTGAPIVFDIGPAPAAEGANVAVLADAVVRAAKGVKDVADDPTGARILANRIDRVAFAPGAAPGVELTEEKVLTIRYVPGRDIDGRPSSAAVARYLEESL